MDRNPDQSGSLGLEPKALQKFALHIYYLKKKQKLFFHSTASARALNLQGALLLKLNESLAIILYKNNTKFIYLFIYFLMCSFILITLHFLPCYHHGNVNSG